MGEHEATGNNTKNVIPLNCDEQRMKLVKSSNRRTLSAAAATKVYIY